MVGEGGVPSHPPSPALSSAPLLLRTLRSTSANPSYRRHRPKAAPQDEVQNEAASLGSWAWVTHSEWARQLARQLKTGMKISATVVLLVPGEAAVVG